MFQSLLLWIWLTGLRRPASRARWLRCFNPCCCGFGSPAVMAIVGRRSEHWMFQSLLLWIWLTGGSARRRSTHRADVSILVVVDLAHRPADRDRPRRPRRVSILVVVDLAHRLGVHGVGAVHTGFNPCCCGFGSPAGIELAWRSTSADVSILVVVDLAHRPDVRSTVPGRRRVSILVVVDLAHRLRQAHHGVRRLRFQSLLLWIWLTGTDRAGRSALVEWMFQSLLLWIWLTGTALMPTDRPVGSRFQSLLLWIWLTGGCTSRSASYCTVFQSLLLWIWLTGP